jgi:SAM-dependent methyltransferase
MLTKIVKWFVHVVIGTRRFYYQKLSAAARSLHGKQILEIGSGRVVDGKYPYSARHLFDSSNIFVCTDIDPSFGHEILDITTMDYQDKFDVILCLNVLEHVYETELALRNLYRAVKKNGVVYIAVPVHFPLHDEPHDYWRFTEHALRCLLHQFENVKIYHNGLRVFPFGYFIEASK